MTNGPGASGSSSTGPARRRSALPLLVALVVGLLVGTYGGAQLTREPGTALFSRAAPAPTVTVTATTGPPPPPPGTSRVSVDVPDHCLVVARRGAGVAGRLNDAVEAARKLQLDRARQLLDEIQQENPQELATSAERCRSAVEALTAASGTPQPPR